VLAKQGVRLERPLTTDAGTFTVGDLLRDTISNYQPEARQIEWICIAIALYLPPQRTWSDKFGHRFSFDDMATALLDRDVASRELPCYGIHILEALTVLCRVDEEYTVLSDSRRTRVRQELTKNVAHLCKTQLRDGSWPEEWHLQYQRRGMRSSNTNSTAHTRVHVTGHHLDWLLLLPRDMMATDDVISRGASWLLGCLLDCPESELIENYCPYSHAGHVLAVLSSSG
jgi:hypothetical protein